MGSSNTVLTAARRVREAQAVVRDPGVKEASVTTFLDPWIRLILGKTTTNFDRPGVREALAHSTDLDLRVREALGKTTTFRTGPEPKDGKPG